jgi:hypothetical protein
VLVTRSVSAFIASMVRIRRVVSKGRDDGAAETDCTNSQDQKSGISREHRCSGPEDNVSYSRHSFCGQSRPPPVHCLEFKFITAEFRRNLHSSFLAKLFCHPTPFGRSRLIRLGGFYPPCFMSILSMFMWSIFMFLSIGLASGICPKSRCSSSLLAKLANVPGGFSYQPGSS